MDLVKAMFQLPFNSPVIVVVDNVSSHDADNFSVVDGADLGMLHYKDLYIVKTLPLHLRHCVLSWSYLYTHCFVAEVIP
jgi:hypothetical protein